MQPGTKVRNKVVIQSDDRSVGTDDGTPVIWVGTPGTVLGRSDKHLNWCNQFERKSNGKLKPGCENCLVVCFELGNGQAWNFDCDPKELELWTPTPELCNEVLNHPNLGLIVCLERLGSEHDHSDFQPPKHRELVAGEVIRLTDAGTLELFDV